GFEWGTGRRKCSVARVRICKGSGKIVINGRDYATYFTTMRHQGMVTGPLKHIDVSSKYDVFANIRGGGQTGQAGAVMMGLGRALIKAEPELARSLRDQGFLSRDSRMVERKKPGKPGARRSFQFSKR
ncbi:MAG: 30S ribosomal protein S9, partial [Planctomycetes bacterium]|nr:30S ribosomal protein S9 [Planctomycetota bacterium]